MIKLKKAQGLGLKVKFAPKATNSTPKTLTSNTLPSGGKYDKINKKINQASESIKNLSERINLLKKAQSRANSKAEKLKGFDNKIMNNLRDSYKRTANEVLKEIKTKQQELSKQQQIQKKLSDQKSKEMNKKTPAELAKEKQEQQKAAKEQKQKEINIFKEFNIY